jgi:hypothetical protein
MEKFMRDLQDLERLEIEILDLLNSKKILELMFFGGGTMLRLCHNLRRYSTDLVFWLKPGAEIQNLFKNINSLLKENYELTDSENKRNTILFEIRTSKYRRNLKIEIRKNQMEFEWERKIAFSEYANKQIPVKGLTLKQMMENKISALLSRKIIRDCHDIQFLIMKGIKLPDDKNTLQAMMDIIISFKTADYKVSLGSILDESERKFHIDNKFLFLREEINKKLLLPG